jgi:hypothetical protein
MLPVAICAHEGHGVAVSTIDRMMDGKGTRTGRLHHNGREWHFTELHEL